MLNEYRRTGRVSLQSFYARRALRLFPASYAFIGCVGILWAAGTVQLRATDMVHAITYTVNYLPQRAWQIGHLWSLSVEEQFYLLWPLAFVLFKPRRAFFVAAGAVLLAPVARAGAWFLLRKTAYYDLELFPTVADSLAIGCLLAPLTGWLESRRLYRGLLKPGCSIGLLGLLLVLNRYEGYSVVRVLGTSVMNVCIVILIHRCVVFPDGLVGRFLNGRLITEVGVLSYSLYLWQQLFINRNSDAWICAFPQSILLAVGTAVGSYFLLEMPFQRLRSRLRGIRKLGYSGEDDLATATLSQGGHGDAVSPG